MRTRKRTGGDQAEVNMTPMLDIVFILLIFFIVTASFLRESGVEIFQPPGPDDPPENDQPVAAILVQIDERNTVYINFRPTVVGQVTANIQKQMVENGGRSAVQIQPHPDTEHGIVMEVYDNALKARPVGIKVLEPSDDEPI